ncbi:hypothetical protein [Pseudonocardia sp.]|uniref:hypothetical protein n=1 Tax=Pseudonocardia sp. TaxID=60912 RepID=UPI0026146CEF|nr:hypothetical protein [Pseudonocardia sp.]
MSDLDDLADALYTAPPADFVATRDEAVRAARERGDREFATAAGRLRRPTRAAWLANLLARHRAEQLDGLLTLAGSLADAQRTLDGDALRALSSRRRQLVAAMAREAGRLAREAHEPVNDSLLRELGDILEAALADPVVADEVRSGRLTRTISYSGFGPEAEPGATPKPREPRPAPSPPPEDAAPEEDPAERARLDRQRAERRRDLDDAEAAEAAARERRDAAESAHEDAAAAHAAARERVARLTEELDAAQKHERTAAADGREAAAAARAAAREASTAATRTARARARLDDLP